jgi:hypothetical protein
MIPYLTLGVGLASFAVILFLAWTLAVPKEEEEVSVVGFRYEPPQEEDEDGC